MSAVDKGCLGLYSITATPSGPSRSRRTRQSRAVDRSLGSESPLWQSVDPLGRIHAQTGGTYIRPGVMHTPADRMHASAYGMFGEMPRPDSMSTNTSFRPPPPWYSPYYTLPQAPVYTWPAPSSPFDPPVHHVSAGGVYGGYDLAAQETDSLSSASEGATLEELSVCGSHDLSPAPPGTDTNYQLPAVPLYSDCLNSFKGQEAIAVPHPRHRSSGARLVHDPSSAPVVPSTRTRRTRSDSNPPLPVPRSPPHTVCKPLSWSAMGPPAPFQGVTRFSLTTLYDADHPVQPIQSTPADSRDVLNTLSRKNIQAETCPFIKKVIARRRIYSGRHDPVHTGVAHEGLVYMGAGCLCPLSPQART
jgi:hypothetical protein